LRLVQYTDIAVVTALCRRAAPDVPAERGGYSRPRQSVVRGSINDRHRALLQHIVLGVRMAVPRCARRVCLRTTANTPSGRRHDFASTSSSPVPATSPPPRASRATPCSVNVPSAFGEGHALSWPRFPNGRDGARPSTREVRTLPDFTTAPPFSRSTRQPRDGVAPPPRRNRATSPRSGARGRGVCRSSASRPPSGC